MGDNKLLCSIEGCEREAKTRGWCNKHYRRWYTYGDPLVVKRTENGEPLRWLLWALEQNTDECLIWPYAVLDDRGYGVSDNRDSTGSMLVHRFICEKANGICPPDHEAAHSCGNPGCCNKKHLRWALHVDNETDKIKHGTKAEGFVFHNAAKAKLTKEQVIEIRRLLSSDEMNGNQIAKQFKVSPLTISFIRRRITWKHLP